MGIIEILTGTRQLTREEALNLAETKWWEGLPSSIIAMLQLSQELMCVDFSVYHKAVEEALDRPVWTHEFADPNRLRNELLGNKPKATMGEIIELIPEEKRIVLRV